MTIDELRSPIVVDGILSDEKLAELLAFQTEYPELDYKSTIDLSTTEGKVELAKDVGAMQVRGGYILGGVDNRGQLTGHLDQADLRPFDEANLVPRLLQWLPEPLVLRTRIAQRDCHEVVVIYVGSNPAGCAFFRADGMYTRRGREEVAFRQGDVFWRDGTRSVRMSQQGLELVMQRRIAIARSLWLEEQHSMRRREDAQLQAAHATGRLTEAPLGSVSLDLEAPDLTVAALEMIRRHDSIGLQHLLNDAVSRARSAIDADDIEAGLADVLDKLICLAARFMTFDQYDWLNRIVAIFSLIYSMPLANDDARRFGYSSRIHPQETAPRVWIDVIARVFALGALAVRGGRWNVVRTLTLQHPDRLTGYEANWLRHAVTMAGRAQHLQEQRDGRTLEISLLSIARLHAARLDCLRSDGLSDQTDELFTSLAQFDVLSNVVAIDGAGSMDGRVFYTNFARFRQSRIEPAVDRLLTDREMRDVLFTRSDQDLAAALATIGQRAEREGWPFDGFESWEHTPVAEFIAKHLKSRPDPDE